MEAFAHAIKSLVVILTLATMVGLTVHLARNMQWEGRWGKFFTLLSPENLWRLFKQLLPTTISVFVIWFLIVTGVLLWFVL